MKLKEAHYELYKKICLRLREYREMDDFCPLVMNALEKCERTKALLDKINPGYKERFLNDNQ